MKKLKDIISNIKVIEIIGRVDKTVEAIEFDSRKASKGSAFVAVKGTQVDGHRYIAKAIEKGASIIVCEDLPQELVDHVTYVLTNSSEQALGRMASNFYNNPSSKLNLVGVTGTNGKTTTVTLLYKLFKELGYKVGLLSTVENRIGARKIASTHTTPDAVQLNELINRMVEKGCDYVFMEVSSHAIDQQRIEGLTFKGGLFTNISHDHLDYHKTFKNYIEAKKKFFDDLPKGSFALTNIDDRRGHVMVQNTNAKGYSYSIRTSADFKAKVIENTLTGLQLELDGVEFHSQLIGEFNAYNLLTVYATAILLGAEKIEVLQALSQLKSAEGRFDYIYSKRKNITGIVDYAHTPDALEKVLVTIDQLKQGNAKVLTVLGCGGDRDKKKRPIMARVATDFSDQVILTSDNPRTENPDTIIQEMEAGVQPMFTSKVVSITDRKQAIRIAVRLANEGDIILVAGKGHEKYQEIMGEKFPFDDKKVLSTELDV